MITAELPLNLSTVFKALAKLDVTSYPMESFILDLADNEFVDHLARRISFPGGLNLTDPLHLLNAYVVALTPPAAPLVGIETNPGPTPKGKELVVYKSKSAKQPKKSKETKIVVKQPRHKILSVGVPRNLAQPVADAYINTLKDPWEYPPVKIGFGTYQPTVLATAYQRSNFTVNADGSFGFIMWPSVQSMTSTNNAGTAVATWVSSNAANASGIQNQMTEGRVVSGGVRIFALFPITSAPGVMYCGTDVSNPLTTMTTTFTPTSISALQASELGIGTSGCRGVMYPIDYESYHHTLPVIGGFAAGAVGYQPAIVISGRGFPVGTVIWYEAVLNIEGLPTSGLNSVGLNPNAVVPDTGLTASFPSLENMHRFVANLLPNASTLDAALNFASSAADAYTRSVRPHGLGSGSNWSNALVAGRSFAHNSRTGTRMLIEEVKDGYERL